jgi:hypothetical protein
MYSAFGIDHGYEEVEKGLNPVKAFKAAKVKNAAQMFQRGHNQQMVSHGVGHGDTGATLKSLVPGMGGHKEYAAGQAAGRTAAGAAGGSPSKGAWGMRQAGHVEAGRWGKKKTMAQRFTREGKAGYKQGQAIGSAEKAQHAANIKQYGEPPTPSWMKGL